MEEALKWKKRFERERKSKKEAERLLEEKSLELWEINQNLEEKVRDRTQKLIDSAISAQQANKSKDAFLASMSHELRTPHNAVIGFSQILLMKKDIDQSIKTYIDKINISGKNLLTLVNTILDFAKLEAGKFEVHAVDFSFQTVINECVVIVEALAAKKNITLDYPKDINLYSCFDPQLIKQVIINLLTNAIKFSQEGSTVAVKLGVSKKDYSVVIGVCDQGIGISKDNLKTLFQPFVQVNAGEHKKNQGTGLGLSISKKIVEDLHNGKIWAKSKLGEGTCFYISLSDTQDNEEQDDE